MKIWLTLKNFLTFSLQHLKRLPQSALLLIIQFYRLFISPVLGQNCRFYPSCSEYAHQAIGRFGIIKGTYLAGRRLLRCNPWHEGGMDPVPAHSHPCCKNKLTVK